MRILSSIRPVRGPVIIGASVALHVLVFLLTPEERAPAPEPERAQSVSIEIVEAPPAEPAQEPVAQADSDVAPDVAPEAPATPPVTVSSQTFEDLVKDPPEVELAPETTPDTELAEPTSTDAATDAPHALAHGDATPGDAEATGADVPALTTTDQGPGNVRLFDGLALKTSVGTWKRDMDDEAAMRAERRALDPASAQAEAARVTGRVAKAVAQADAMARVQGGFRSSCDDGVDNDHDGTIDCADPACRKRPECAGTGVYEETPWMDIPDANEVGLASIINVSQPGEVRKLAVRIQIAHTSPGDVTMLLENIESGKSVVLKNADRGDATLEPAFHLTDFNGTPAKGKWRLKIRDEYAGTRGKLKKWWLYITS